MQIFSAQSPEELNKLKNQKNSRTGADSGKYRSQSVPFGKGFFMDDKDFDILDSQTYLLFSCSYNDMTEEQYDYLYEIIQWELSEFGWDDTFRSWEKYLFTECVSPESVVNFANLFWCYGGCEHRIPDPCRFLAYFYYRVGFDGKTYDLNEDKYGVLGILDSLGVSVMLKAGFRHADLVENPYYTPESDPLITAEIKAFFQEER